MKWSVRHYIKSALGHASESQISAELSRLQDVRENVQRSTARAEESAFKLSSTPPRRPSILFDSGEYLLASDDS